MPCEECSKVKAHPHPAPKKVRMKETKWLGRVEVDLMRPMEYPEVGDRPYARIFADNVIITT